MQHRDMLPFLVTQVTENVRKRKIAFFVSVPKNATEGIFRGYYKNIEYQQNLDTLPITVIVLSTRLSKIHCLQSLIPQVVATLEESPGKRLIKIQGS